MSALHTDPPPSSNTTAHRNHNSHALALKTDGLMTDDVASQDETSKPATLDAHDDARAVIRLIQCPACSKPYTSPVTLPCGRSVCRACLPESYEREATTWPNLPERRRAIQCPIRTCGKEHTVAECNVDVVLSKVMESIAEVIAKENSIFESNPSLSGDVDLEKHTADGETKQIRQSLGRLVPIYISAASGQLALGADYSQDADQPRDEAVERNKDETVLAGLLNACQRQLDCQVCYNLMYDPVTTSCGHTHCRQCLIRSLDHSQNCPVCRRVILAQPSLHSQPSNHTLGELLQGLCPELVAARKDTLDRDEAALMGAFDTPLFIVTLGFPGCPTFLRIFEPRYRLMLRRALEGNRTFGVVMYNAYGTPQGDLGRTTFMQYGTLLRIEHAQMMPNGTSIIEARGVARFKVLTAGVLDGYAVGRVERVEDIPLAEEEALEIAEASLGPAAEADLESQLNRMTTEQLLNLGLEFVTRMQGRSASWLHEGILQAYGNPPQNAAMFPYWFASILPIADDAKYHLLHTTSVRQRLKITARWVKLMEQQRWYHSNSCNVL